MKKTTLVLVPALLATAALPARHPRTEPRASATEDARAAIVAAYREWGRARVELDREALDAALAPEFRVLLEDGERSREDFLAEIGRPRLEAHLTRFDVSVLTVRRKDPGWEAVIAEKLEHQVPVPGGPGAMRTVYSLWVTRDGFRVEDGAWLATYSEEIGHENWADGPPPFPDW